MSHGEKDNANSSYQWYFEPYCEHLLKMVNIPLGAKSVHISSVLASISTDYKLVYYNDTTGYVHCASQDSKEKLLLRDTLSLLVANAPVKNDAPASNKSVPKPKPDPLPVMV